MLLLCHSLCSEKFDLRQAKFFYCLDRIIGALIATSAVVLPAFLVILLVTGLLKAAIKNPYVQAILRGVKPCMVGVVTATGLYMTAQCCMPKDALIDIRAAVIIAILAGSMLLYRHFRKKKLSPILLIVLSAVLGILLY